MEGTIRTFVSIELPPEVRRILLSGREPLEKKHPGLKWVDEKALHITLRFCGEAPSQRAEIYAESLGRVLKNRGFPSFSLIPGPPGGLPSLAAMRVLYAGLEGETQTLRSLAEAAEEAGERRGTEGSSRPFLPHITLARARNPLRLPREELPVFSPVPWRVNRVVLMKSTLLPSGPLYTPLYFWSLGEGEM